MKRKRGYSMLRYSAKRVIGLILAAVMTCSLLTGADLTAKAAGDNEVQFSTDVRVKYRTHVQTYGWQDWKADGELSGTTGQAKRLEGIEIKLENQPYSGGIMYRTHVQTYGWEEGYKENGQMSGTSGQAKRLEAIQIELYGEMAEHYHVFYRVYVQSYGWLGWTVDGNLAGTEGYAKRLEGIEIFLLRNDEEIPEDVLYDMIYGEQGAFAADIHSSVEYITHIQSYGWAAYSFNGQVSGTVGKAKRLEGISIFAADEYGTEGGITYRTHVQTYGWEQEWVYDGEVSGTEGEAKRLEAIQIQLYGEMAQKYDVYYRVHAQSYGWLGWAKNGQSAGTEGLAKRLEAIQIVLVKKGGKAPGSTANAFIKK